MNTAYLLLGSNLGDREASLSRAIELISQNAGKITSASAVYNTAPWGNSEQSDFLNQAICISTSLAAPQLLECLFSIEKMLGRSSTKKWDARIIDIDMLFFNEEIIESPNLSVPHPFLHQRRFALIPLSEIAGNFIHPTLKKTIQELLKDTQDDLKVTIHNKI